MQEHLTNLAWELANLVDLLEGGQLSEAQQLAKRELARVHRMLQLCRPVNERPFVPAVEEWSDDTK